MSLLTIIQDAADLIGLPRPQFVVAATDPTTRQLLALANLEGKELARRYAWQELLKEATFTSVAAELQGTLASIASDYGWAVSDTVWDRSQTVPVNGPLSPQQWQALKSSNVSGPYGQYRIRDSKLYIIPAPTAGRSMAFEYVSKNWCQSSGGTAQSAWAADTDTGILPEHLMTLGLRWRFKHSRGLSYAEDFRAYEMQVANSQARGSGSGLLSLAGPASADNYPGMRVPEGSWNIP